MMSVTMESHLREWYPTYLCRSVQVESRDGSGYENAKRQYLADGNTHHHFLSPRFATSSGVGCDLAWEPYA
ncbi:hypothetical protein BDZ97DRAFT_2071179 [Flammula alnicola]|nr:hypothetical protein BDZ97DRAFT_2071179 [Flammula alnicola]